MFLLYHQLFSFFLTKNKKTVLFKKETKQTTLDRSMSIKVHNPAQLVVSSPSRTTIINTLLQALSGVPHENACVIFDLDMTLIGPMYKAYPDMLALLHVLKVRFKYTIVLITARQSHVPYIKVNESTTTARQYAHVRTVEQLHAIGALKYIDFIYQQKQGELCPGLAKFNARKELTNMGYKIVLLVGDCIWDIFNVTACARYADILIDSDPTQTHLFYDSRDDRYCMKMPEFR